MYIYIFCPVSLRMGFFFFFFFTQTYHCIYSKNILFVNCFLYKIKSIMEEANDLIFFSCKFYNTKIFLAYAATFYIK